MVERSDQQPYQFMQQNNNVEFNNIYERQEYVLNMAFRPHGLTIPPPGPSEPIERCRKLLDCGD